VALVAAAAAALAWASAGRCRSGWAAALLTSLVLAGAQLGAVDHPAPPPWPARPPREARLSLRIDRVFAPAPPGRSATGWATVVRADPHLRELVGQRLYYSIGLRRAAEAPDRSAVVRVIGLLRAAPRAAAPGSFDASLAAEGVYLRLVRARLLGEEQPPDAYRRGCARLADQLTRLLGLGLGRHPALRALYGAMMLGRKADLAKDQRALFLRAGAMHLFAVNGIHIGTVALALHALAALVRLPRTAASGVVLACLWLDVASTGASPSAVRAFIMVAAAESAWALRRPSNPLASLSTAALIVLLVDPGDLFSASFQMSYGVMAALATLGLPLAARAQARFAPYRSLPRVAWNRRQRLRAGLQRHLIDALGIGAAAAAVGAVSGIEYFHLLVPGALLTNLFLVPPALLVIVAGVGAIAAGLSGATPVARFCNGAAGVVLAAMTATARLATKAPAMAFAAHFRAAWIGPAALVLLLAACLLGYALDWRARCGGFWPPFAIVATVLALGVSYP
jgi:competence protein ComEC